MRSALLILPLLQAFSPNGLLDIAKLQGSIPAWVDSGDLVRTVERKEGQIYIRYRCIEDRQSTKTFVIRTRRSVEDKIMSGLLAPDVSALKDPVSCRVAADVCWRGSMQKACQSTPVALGEDVYTSLVLNADGTVNVSETRKTPYGPSVKGEPCGQLVALPNWYTVIASPQVGLVTTCQ